MEPLPYPAYMQSNQSTQNFASEFLRARHPDLSEPFPKARDIESACSRQCQTLFLAVRLSVAMTDGRSRWITDYADACGAVGDSVANCDGRGEVAGRSFSFAAPEA